MARVAGQAPSAHCGGECPGLAQGASVGPSQWLRVSASSVAEGVEVCKLPAIFHEQFQTEIRTKWPFLNRINMVSEFIICLFVLPAGVSARHCCLELCWYSQGCIQLFPLLSEALEQGLECSGSEGFGQCLPVLFLVLAAS